MPNNKLNVGTPFVYVCTNVMEKMFTDPNEVVNSAGAYIKSYLAKIDEYVYRIHEWACTNIHDLRLVSLYQ